MTRKLLVVDPDLLRARQLARTVEHMAAVDVAADFATARRVLLAKSPDFLVANLRLGAYNGLHLVHIAHCSHISARAIVYTDSPEPGLGSEIQAAGAFYETLDHLRRVLPSYVTSPLPARDRRDVWRTALEESASPSQSSAPHVASWFAH